MIVLSSVTHEVRVGSSVAPLMSNATLRIPTDRRIALLGCKGPVTTTLFDLLSGVVPPLAGIVTRNKRVSFPVGFSGGFWPELTVRQNVEFVARIYDQPLNEMVDFVAKLSEIGAAFDQPLIKLPRPTLREIASIVAFSIPFDMYLVTANRKIAVSPLWKKFYELFKLRAATSGFIASADPHFARLHCDMGMVLRSGRLELVEDVEKAIRFASEAVADIEEPEREDEEPGTTKSAEDWM